VSSCGKTIFAVSRISQYDQWRLNRTMTPFNFLCSSNLQSAISFASFSLFNSLDHHCKLQSPSIETESIRVDSI